MTSAQHQWVKGLPQRMPPMPDIPFSFKTRIGVTVRVGSKLFKTSDAWQPLASAR